MTVTLTPRLGLAKAGAGTDPWPGRTGWNEDYFDVLDAAAAIDVVYTDEASMAAAGIRGRYAWCTAESSLWRDTGAAWKRIWTSDVTLNQIGAPTASVDMNSQKIVNLLAGVAAGDAINKAQLDALAAVKLNGIPAPDGPLSMSTQKITGLVAGSDSTDAATKGQVDTVAAAIPEIRRGRGVTASAGAGAGVNESLAFGFTFAAAPILLVTMRTDSDFTGSQLFLWVKNVTTSGATLRFWNASGGATVVAYDWLAIEV